MQIIKIKQEALFPALIFIYLGQVCYGQLNSCDRADKELTKLYLKIYPFYNSDLDSLLYYSDLFSSRLLSYIKRNPGTIECNFELFKDSVGSIVTTSDGQFRIYSWNTWTGGTMDNYKNLFQFKSGDKVYAKDVDYGEGDMGTYFTDVYSLKADNMTYILAIAGGTESSRYAYEFLTIYSISDSTLNDKVPIIETSSGLKNSIIIEFDMSSVENRPERPYQLIKYDKDNKILYVPIILEDGKVTEKYVPYQFTGEYFEEILPLEKNREQQ
jgi:hypothetical protein